jgi:hypothetical protein
MIIGLPLALLAAETPPNAGPEIIKLNMGEKLWFFSTRNISYTPITSVFTVTSPRNGKSKNGTRKSPTKFVLPVTTCTTKVLWNVKGVTQLNEVNRAERFFA